MRHITREVILATVFASALILAQEPTSAGSGLESTTEALLDSTAVVVLPVEIRSNDPNYPRLAVAVYNEFIAQLRMIDGVHVIDPALVTPYSTSSLEPEQIARQLGAASVLQSSVSADSPGYTIGYALIDVNSGNHHSSGGMRGTEEWDRQHPLDEDVREQIAATIGRVEEHLFPERRDANKHAVALAEAKARFLDSSLSDRARLKALWSMRPPMMSGYLRRYADGGVWVTDDVASAAVQLGTAAKDPSVRWSVWSVMVGVGHPYLINPLLHALSGDPASTVRTKAAEALAAHIESPGVRDALHDAKKNDPDRLVRKAASLTTATEKEYRELKRQTAMDKSLPERERFLALNTLSIMNRETEAISDVELATAMLSFAESVERHRHRRSIWYIIGQIGGSTMMPTLIDALFNEPEESVRESIASSLSKSIDEPGVRDALVKAQSSDRSPLVRAAAKCALQGGGWC